jgi:hypothetical protein
MTRLLFCMLLIPLSVSCQTKKALKSAQSQPVSEGTPMSCRIEGRVTQILKPEVADKGSICARYSCKARVKILDVSACGSSVSMPLNAGDTVMVRFAYTLHATAKLFPNMKVQFPGLKKGSVFYANAEQRLVMGAGSELVVTSYFRK